MNRKFGFTELFIAKLSLQMELIEFLIDKRYIEFGFSFGINTLFLMPNYIINKNKIALENRFTD